MAYATISDVNALVPQVPFTAQSTPSQAMVEQFLTDITTILNASLGNLGYTVPVNVVASPLSGILLKRICSWGAAGLALQVRQSSVQSDDAVGDNVWTKRFDKYLDMLQDNRKPFELPDAPRTGKEIIKPLGDVQADATSLSVDSGSAQDPYDYLTNPPFRIGQVF